MGRRTRPDVLRRIHHRSNYANGTKLSGTESATAQNLLQQAAPSVSGDTERIVFATKHAQITQPAVRTAVDATLAKVARLPGVTGVTTPYTAAGAKQLSQDGHVAFATVNFRKDANKVSAQKPTNSSRRRARRTGAVSRWKSSVRSRPRPTLRPRAAPCSESPQRSSCCSFVFGSLLSALLPLASTGLSLFAALSVVGAPVETRSRWRTSPRSCASSSASAWESTIPLFILTRAPAQVYAAGLSVEEAVTTAGATAGRAVLFAG